MNAPPTWQERARADKQRKCHLAYMQEQIDALTALLITHGVIKPPLDKEARYCSECFAKNPEPHAAYCSKRF